MAGALFYGGERVQPARLSTVSGWDCDECFLRLPPGMPSWVLPPSSGCSENVDRELGEVQRGEAASCVCPSGGRGDPWLLCSFMLRTHVHPSSAPSLLSWVLCLLQDLSVTISSSSHGRGEFEQQCVHRDMGGGRTAGGHPRHRSQLLHGGEEGGGDAGVT